MEHLDFSKSRNKEKVYKKTLFEKRIKLIMKF